jgi:hypothetical protein
MSTTSAAAVVAPVLVLVLVLALGPSRGVQADSSGHHHEGVMRVRGDVRMWANGVEVAMGESASPSASVVVVGRIPKLRARLGLLDDDATDNGGVDDMTALGGGAVLTPSSTTMPMPPTSPPRWVTYALRLSGDYGHGRAGGGGAGVAACLGEGTVIDKSWRCIAAYPGDDSGWRLPGFDDSAWPAAATQPDSGEGSGVEDVGGRHGGQGEGNREKEVRALGSGGEDPDPRRRLVRRQWDFGGVGLEQIRARDAGVGDSGVTYCRKMVAFSAATRPTACGRWLELDGPRRGRKLTSTGVGGRPIPAAGVATERNGTMPPPPPPPPPRGESPDETEAAAAAAARAATAASEERDSPSRMAAVVAVVAVACVGAVAGLAALVLKSSPPSSPSLPSLPLWCAGSIGSTRGGGGERLSARLTVRGSLPPWLVRWLPCGIGAREYSVMDVDGAGFEPLSQWDGDEL